MGGRDTFSTVRGTFTHDVDLVTAPSGLGPDDLRSWGSSPALIADDETVDYATLADLVERRRGELGVGRRLVVVESSTTVHFVTTLLAALSAGCPVILAADHRQVRRLTDIYRPDVVVRSGTASIEHRTDPAHPSPHDLHPDLALLMSTSGSTGDAKLVRLSHEAVTSNARSIADYLALDERDRGITSLPLHYCYGLSVLTSHLSVGAGVVLSTTSVVDPCFREAVRRHGVTGFAGVPHTFELLDAAGDGVLHAPSLRYVTQAGGRLAPDRVTAFAESGRRLGWDLFVMYGQTEATARMAYLPPDEAFRRPESVGVAIPDGELHIDEAAAPAGTPPGVGEIVYRGPNVMMGYAHEPGNLAEGHLHDELRTGDLGRLDDDGFLVVVGRVRRFVKIHGKRVDLDHVESRLSEAGHAAVVAGDDEGLVVATERATPLGDAIADPVLLDATVDVVDVPRGRITAIALPAFPRTDSGKIDAPALQRCAHDVAARPRGHDDSVSGLFAEVLGHGRIDPAATFASCGGDSFSYVEMSVRLESLLGSIPRDWHLTPVSELEAMRDSQHGTRGGRFTRLETGVVIRAVAILLIVCTHMRLYRLPGGAHTLLAVLGYNFARFQLPPTDLPQRLRRSVATVARVAVPTSAWIGVNMLVAGGYSLGALLLVNNYTGDAARRGGRWEYWYFEAFVQIMVVLAVVFSIGAIRNLERRVPFAFALAVLGATLLIRFDAVQWGGEYNEMFRTHSVACFVALGWCAQRARTLGPRLVVTALTAVTAIGYFGQTDREWRIILFVWALVWIPTIPLPRRLGWLTAQVAGASMWIFLVHWQVWPLFTRVFDRHVAFLATIAAGVLVWHGYERVRSSFTVGAGREFVERLPSRLRGPRQRIAGLPTRH